MPLRSPSTHDRAPLGGTFQGRLFASVALLAILIVGGTAGFKLIEGWSWWDSFYMLVITASTVGFGEVHPLSQPGQVFAVLIIGGGVAVGSYVLLVVTRTFFEGVVEGSLARALARRRMEKELPRLRGHTVVCGFGHVGREISCRMAAEFRQVVVVERSRRLRTTGSSS